MERPPSADRILVLRLGAMGDVVRTLPAAKLLREVYPTACITWLVEPASASLLEAQPWLDEVLVFPRPLLRESLRRGHLGRASRDLRGFLRALRSKRFDLVVDFHSILKSGLLSLASGGRRRVAYARPFGREAAWLFATDLARLEPRRMSRFERNLGLVRFLGIDASADGRPLRVDGDAGASTLAALGVTIAPVVIHPGTSDATPHKRYAAKGFAAVARSLAEDPGIPTIVTAGPAESDREAAEAVVSAAEGAARLAPVTPISPRSSRAVACSSGTTPGRCTSRRSWVRRWCRSSGPRIRSRTLRSPRRPPGPCGSPSPAAPVAGAARPAPACGSCPRTPWWRPPGSCWQARSPGGRLRRSPPRVQPMAEPREILVAGAFA
jgi:ADP-heptose:LPS heptosyltransferase